MTERLADTIMRNEREVAVQRRRQEAIGALMTEHGIGRREAVRMLDAPEPEPEE